MEFATEIDRIAAWFGKEDRYAKGQRLSVLELDL